MGGYRGKILRIDLTNSEIKEEKLEEKILKKFIGCWGLALKILYDELPLGVHPLEPENPLIFMTGPLTGIPWIPTGNQTSIATLNASTGFTAGRSHSHGFFGPMLKFAGYDGLIIQGASKTPVYLWIRDGRVDIKDATKFWGKDTHESEDLIKEDIGEPRASVATIGPAGENLCAGALIENDKNHTFAHSGVGAVMGSKKLKAIAVYGSERVQVADENKIREIGAKWKHVVMNEFPTTRRRERGGIARTEYEFLKKRYLVSAKNFLETVPPEFGVGMSKNKIIPKACFACPIACSYDVEITSGPYQGYVATLGGGGESIEGATSICGVYGDAGTLFYLTDLLDRLGFDTSTLGTTVALVIEAYEKGLITKEDTNGIELRWGDAKLLEKLYRMAAYREGWLGNLLSLGPKRAAEAIGGDALKFAVHVKGAGINLHDWRNCWGILVGQILGGGSGWPAQGADYISEPDLGMPTLQDPFDWKVKAKSARIIGMKKYWEDCIGTCLFATWGVPGALKYAAEAVSAATGWNITQEDALLIGERIMNLERVFNVRRGLTPEDDLDVPPRLLEPPPNGPGKGKSIASYLRGIIMEYYRLMGWDEKTGKPWKSTLRRLDLEDLISDIWD
ncbi:MAG: aldehyde ferredoxin oxidoreductase C-terminal domain-containing protein [Nitrososphaerota archaeon]|nr:aldehyde ferredoxin oxidoreductase C-terminal domain-containing protein [Nitrososphaerota archaeon]